MLLFVDKNRPESIFEQLVGQIQELVDTGDLKEGFKMPATRELATQLGINRSTVIRVYQELWALGYLESTPGSYTRVRRPRRGKSRSAEQEEVVGVDWDGMVSGYRQDINKVENFARVISENDNDVIAFHRLEPDIRLIDKSIMASCFRQLMADPAHNLFGYSHPRGYIPLRGAIAQHMRRHGIEAEDENILVTNGSQNSLQLIFQTFLKRGDVVAVETPTYSLLIPLLRLYSSKVVEIPSTSQGMDVTYLENVLQREKVKLIYTIPTFNNPTGATMPQENRERLLALCEAFDTIIVEDSIEEELKFFGRVHLPIKSMDTQGRVIYLGTFSKILAPGLRTGWIVAHPECINRLAALKTVTDLSSNTLSQALLERFCESGGYELHIRKLQRAFRKRMRTAIRAIKTYLPPDMVEWSEPMGGYLIWLKFLGIPQELSIAEYFKKHGVAVADGRTFFFSSPREHFVRLSISRLNEMEIEEGVKRMGKALNELHGCYNQS